MRVNAWRVGEKYFKASRGCYYCKVTHPNGKREDRKLLPDADKAAKQRRKLVTQLEETGEPTPAYLVKDLCFLFLDHVKANNAAKTYVWYRQFVKSFCEHIPPLKVADLKLHHAQKWLSECYPRNRQPKHPPRCHIGRQAGPALTLG
jgi:hypothetical protein